MENKLVHIMNRLQVLKLLHLSNSNLFYNSMPIAVTSNSVHMRDSKFRT